MHCMYSVSMATNIGCELNLGDAYIDTCTSPIQKGKKRYLGEASVRLKAINMLMKNTSVGVSCIEFQIGFVLH